MSYTQHRIVSDDRICIYVYMYICICVYVYIYILDSDTNRTTEKLKVGFSLSWGQSQAMQRLPRTLAK